MKTSISSLFIFRKYDFVASLLKHLTLTTTTIFHFQNWRRYQKRIWIFTTNSYFHIPISLQPDVVNLCYYKLKDIRIRKSEFVVKTKNLSWYLHQFWKWKNGSIRLLIFFLKHFVSFFNYRKSKTIFKSFLNSHVYWDTLYHRYRGFALPTVLTKYWKKFEAFFRKISISCGYSV